MTSFDKKFIARLKESYRAGTRVRLIHMDDEQAPPKHFLPSMLRLFGTGGGL